MKDSTYSCFVGKGSENPPVVITMTYNGGDSEDAPIALVGKVLHMIQVAIALNRR